MHLPKRLRAGFVLGLSVVIALGSVSGAFAKKKKTKKKKNLETEDKYEDSKYLSHASGTGGPYRFDAEGHPITQSAKKKPKKKKKGLKSKKTHAASAAGPAPSMEKKKMAPVSSFNEPKPEQNPSNEGAQQGNSENPTDGGSPPPTGGSGISIAP